MNDAKAILLGAGGHARVLLDLLDLQAFDIVGVTAPELVSGKEWFGIAVLDFDKNVTGFPINEVLLINAVGGIPGQRIRQRLYTEFKDMGFRFATLQHPSSIVSRSAELAEGVQLMAGSILQPGVKIGVNVLVNTRASIDHDCVIGAHAFIGPAVTLCGDVQVGEGAFIGAGAVVLPGVQIGAGAIVGAGSVVIRSVAKDMRVVGNPAIQMK